jgi:hypothetical protein
MTDDEEVLTMIPSEPPSSDRRTAERHLACFPAAVERPDGEQRTSVIHDLSITGALLLVRTTLAVGDRVKLQLHISDDVEEVRDTIGHVVRVDPLAENEIGLWASKVAVHFDEPLTIYEKEIEELHARQSRLGM